MTKQDTERLRGLAHQLAEAVTAANAHLHGGLHLDGQDGLREAISKAIEQTDRVRNCRQVARSISGLEVLVVSGAKPRASRLNGLSAATDEVWEVRNDR